MHKLDIKMDVNIENLKLLINYSDDLALRKIKIHNTDIACLFFESVSSGEKITNIIMKGICFRQEKTNIFSDVFDELNSILLANKISHFESLDDLFYYLSLGFICILIDGFDNGICVEVRADLNRSITEPPNEKVLRGPKDGFTESIVGNLGLIRKRIKDPNLWTKDVILGRRTKTKISIIYINDIADDKLANSIYEKLSKIDIDGILDSGYIVSFLSDENNSFFPKIICTERPDIVSASLLEGKVALMVENSPFVLVMPGVFNDFLHNPEDYYQKPINATITRFLRLLAFFITLLLPALYIALTTFNQEIIPFNLLISIASERGNVPFSTAVELIMLILMFELLRESNIRVPEAMGTSVGIVGALILGDAAVSAGIISPIVVIIVAITSVCGLLFKDIDVINACRYWRMIFIIGAIFFGIIGILIVGLLFVINLACSKSFGTPYLYPFSPFYINDINDSLILASRAKMKTRPSLFSKKNMIRLGDKDED